MAMTIRFTRGGGKPDAVSCFRADGTSTYSKGALAIHDLVHYAVESELNLRASFYSLVDRGVDIGAFTAPRAQWTFEVSEEAGLTEFIVNAFQMELVNHEPYDDLNAELTRMCDQHGHTAPTLSPDEIARIRISIARLLGRWHATAPGAYFEVPWPPEDSSD